MQADARGRKYMATLPQVVKPLEYRLQIGDSQTPRYKVGTYERPTVTDVETTYEFPTYLGRTAQIVKQHARRPGGPPVHEGGAAHSPVDAGRARPCAHRGPESPRLGKRTGPDVGGASCCSRKRPPIPSIWSLSLGTPTRSRASTGSRSCPTPRRPCSSSPLLAKAAWPREARRRSPSARPMTMVWDRSGSNGSRRPRAPRPAPQVETVTSWSRFPKPTERRCCSHPLEFCRPHASSRGRRSWCVPWPVTCVPWSCPVVNLQPQEDATPWHQVHILAPEAKSAAELAQLESLREAIGKILREQVQARVAAAEAPRQADWPDADQHAGAVRGPAGRDPEGGRRGGRERRTRPKTRSRSPSSES